MSDCTCTPIELKVGEPRRDGTHAVMRRLLVAFRCPQHGSGRGPRENDEGPAEAGPCLA